MIPMHNSLKTYAWEESDLPVVNFNLELVSKVNCGGESVNFKKKMMLENCNSVLEKNKIKHVSWPAP